MAAEAVLWAHADELGIERKAELLRIVEIFYREPQSGLDEELRFGDRVYFMVDEDGTVGSFLIVGFNHHTARVADRTCSFTYLGLGCATRTPFVPILQTVKGDVAEACPEGTTAILHLSTRTPFAYHGVERAFGSMVFPASSLPGLPLASQIAQYIKTSIHKHPQRVPGEDPFLLGNVKKVRFGQVELERIKGFSGETPLTRYDLTDDNSDEVIVFHMFDIG